MTENTDRKPRLALLGEFSAGKSTLTNVLLGQTTAQTQVTATQLPPIWYSYGDAQPYRIDLEGAEHPLDGAELATAPLDDTRALRVFLDAPVLRDFDLIDMPGSSDPNLPADAWDALMPELDAVAWCTPATQAWRQSEAAIWENVPDRLFARSVLVLTRADKIASRADRNKVVARLRRETGSQFVDVVPVSLRDALAAEMGSQAWADSGMTTLYAAILSLAKGPTSKSAAASDDPEGVEGAALDKPPCASETVARPAGILPRRVVGGAGASGRRTPRPTRRDGPMI